MKLSHLLVASAAIVALAGGTALAESTKSEKQAEVRKVSQATLSDFYKAEPKLKGQVAKAPGYATFTTYGGSFILGGAGGKGIVHDNKTGQVTFMDMAQASVGVQVGASQSKMLIVFKSAEAMKKFVDQGWDFGGGGGASAGFKGKDAGSNVGQNLIAEADFFTLTPNGFQAGGAVAGTKVWKDKELN